MFFIEFEEFRPIDVVVDENLEIRIFEFDFVGVGSDESEDPRTFFVEFDQIVIRVVVVVLVHHFEDHFESILHFVANVSECERSSVFFVDLVEDWSEGDC